MTVVAIRNQQNEQVGELTLAPEVFEVPVRPEILNLVVRSQRAKVRSGTHATKNRSAKRGGGAKPWRQKGTGRARAGTIRSPLWRGGGVVFGPSPRDYSFKVNKKVRKLALRMALSSRVCEDKLLVVDTISLETIRTKDLAAVTSTLGLKKALIVVEKEDRTLALSCRNLAGIKILPQSQLNVYDVLKYPQVVFFEEAARAVEQRLQ